MLGLFLLFPLVGCKADDDSDTPSPTSYTVTVTSSEHGTVTANPTSATKGTNITLTVTPETGYQLKTITAKTSAGADVTLTPDNNDSTKYKFTMPESNVTVSATFEVIPPTTYTVTVASGIEHGTVTSNAESAAAGADVVLTVSPAEGYKLKTITAKTAVGADVTLTPDNSDSTKYKFTMPESNVTVGATFAHVIEMPLTLEAAGSGTISVANPWSTLKYTKNGGELTAYSAAIEVAAGDKVSFFAESSENKNYQNMSISSTADCYVYGNIMSLVTLEAEATDASKWNPNATSLTTSYAFSYLFSKSEYDDHIKISASKPLCLPATSLSERCYDHMFYKCTGLTSAPALPATSLNAYCYYSMFSYCSSLTTAPALPASTLADSCYAQMFYECSSLTTAPELPATTLTNMCYSSMFQDCTSLTTASELPATTLTSMCYKSMFKGCTNLTRAPELKATTLTNKCYQYMFTNCTKLNEITCFATSISASECTKDWVDGVASSGTFVKASGTTWGTGTSGIPSGWTTEDAQ